jgi:Tfp pilus assembly protein PilO
MIGGLIIGTCIFMAAYAVGYWFSSCEQCEELAENLREDEERLRKRHKQAERERRTRKLIIQAIEAYEERK